VNVEMEQAHSERYVCRSRERCIP